MAKVNKPEFAQAMIDELNIQPASSTLKNEVSDSVQAVYVAERKFPNIVLAASRTSTGSTTIYTVPTGKVFYLYGGTLSFDLDATNDTTAMEYRVSSQGATTNRNLLFIVRSGAGSAQRSGNQTLSVAVPIKLSAGDIVQIGWTFTVGSGKLGGSLVGYEENI